MHKIDWCERCIQLEYIATKNVGDNDLNPITRTLLQEG